MTVTSSQLVQEQNMSNAARAAAQQASSTKTSGSSISSSDFLFLLTQQLQYQDPMNPMDNSEMLAQEAQFATLEQMEALTSSFTQFSSMYQANSLLGQKVEVMVSGKATTGVVEYVDYSDSSGAAVSIDGKMYPLNSVTKVYPESSTGEVSQEEHNSFVRDALSYLAVNFKEFAQKISEHLGIDFGDGETTTPPEGGDGGSGGEGGDGGSDSGSNTEQTIKNII